MLYIILYYPVIYHLTIVLKVLRFLRKMPAIKKVHAGKHALYKEARNA
jgi:hypothetical protein